MAGGSDNFKVSGSRSRCKVPNYKTSRMRTLSRISLKGTLSRSCTVMSLSAATRLYTMERRRVDVSDNKSAPNGCLRRAMSRNAPVSLSKGKDSTRAGGEGNLHSRCGAESSWPTSSSSSVSNKDGSKSSATSSNAPVCVSSRSRRTSS